jgi:hypothetical protein
MATVVWDTPVMGQQWEQGVSKRRSARRVAGFVCMACTSACFVLAGNSPAFATPIGTQFVPVPASVVWPATMADGTPQSSSVTVDTAEVATGNDLQGGVQLAAGQSYFYVVLHTSYAYSVDPHTPFAMPATAATLMTAQGTVTGIPSPPSSFAIDGSWYFPVPANLTSASLQIASFTKVLGDDRGNFTQWTFNPTPIAFVAQPVTPSAAPGAGQASVGGTASNSASPPTRTTSPIENKGGAKGGGPPVGVTLGAGAVGAVVLGTAGAGLVSIMRRRAFSRADHEGRVMLSGPPLLVAGAAGLAAVAGAPDRHAIFVKLLGPLEVHGTRQPITAGPLLEVMVFLALNPGKTFTSVQLREEIWGLGRRPITSNTFRKYLVQFRKACGPGVVVTDVYRYELTDAVLCDWDLFQAALNTDTDRDNDDVLMGQEEALGFVRGPVLNGSFDGKKNSPFTWATERVFLIEDEVISISCELAIACLDLNDPKRAKSAIAQGLLCSDANMALRIVDLQVGAAFESSRELDRRLEAGRAAMATFPNDVAKLEAHARALGWAPRVSS